MGGGGEHGHVHPDLGDEVLGGDAADAGDAVELRHLVLKRGDELFDLGGQLVDLGAQAVDVLEHDAQHEGVVVGEGVGPVQGLVAAGGVGQPRAVAAANVLQGFRVVDRKRRPVGQQPVQ